MIIEIKKQNFTAGFSSVGNYKNQICCFRQEVWQKLSLLTTNLSPGNGDFLKLMKISNNLG